MVVLATIFISLHNYQAISTTLAQAQNYYEARQLSTRMLESLIREESSLRGFTSTGDGIYLKSASDARRTFASQYSALALFSREAGLRSIEPSLRDIRRLHDQWVNSVARPLVTERLGELAEGRQRTGELLFSALGDDVEPLSNRLDAEARSSSARARLRISLAIDELVALSLLFGFVLLRMRHANRVAERRFLADLTESNHSLSDAQRLARVGNWNHDLISGKLIWSDEMLRIFRVTPDEVSDALLRTFDHPADAHMVSQAAQDARVHGAAYNMDHRILLRDGSVRYVQEQAECIVNAAGEPVRINGSVLDVTERKQAEERLAHIAHHDALTGLPNRALLLDRLARSIRDARRHERGVAVLVLDVDRFKFINDTLGHACGDEVLKELGVRLTASVRDGDTVARAGGDEFMIVLADIAKPSDVNLVIDAITRAVDRPFQIDKHEFFVTVSVGASMSPLDSGDIEALIKYADAAMYKAKGEGPNNVRLYTQDMQQAASRKLSLERDLRRAVERQEFVVHYQPIISVATQSLMGLEALVRWPHPQLGSVPPNEFIPLAEDMGIIVPLGEWVLKTACAQHETWRRLGYMTGRMSVNLSARQFQQVDLAQTISTILEATGLAPGHLQVELTETLVMRDVAASTRMLQQMRDLGVAVCLDDFGTGYSSLAYLKSFPIDALKIDQSFIQALTDERFDEAIPAAIIALARSLKLRVVAEGVETAQQFLQLQRLHCDEAQGFYLGIPRPADEWLAVFEQRSPQKVAL